MKKIAIFENAIANHVTNLREEGINRTAFWAYCSWKKNGNEYIDFADVIWDADVPEIVKIFKENGINEFTISSTFSSLISTLVLFAEHGFQVSGLTEVTASYTDFRTHELAKVPALKMINIYD